MKYAYLGRTGVQVSRLCMGTMTFGREADEQASAAMFRRCREVGINFFDTANIYNGGRSEQILGRLLADCRDEIVLTSKVHGPTGPDLNARGLSRRHILRAVEASLRRLQTDRLDLYFLHQFDPGTPMEETLRALEELVRQGKILYPAVSNWAAWQIAKALGIQALRGWARIECIQPMYNLVKRQAEVEILPLAQSEQLGVIPYNPLGGGLLSGKYGARRKPKHARLVDNKQYAKRYGAPSYFELARRFVRYARRHKTHPVSLAVAWVMSHPAVTAPILGARSVAQLQPALEAVNLDLSPDRRAEISALAPAPPPATDRSEEQAKT
jgi:aryl-alcohol dehydrogenase-like predicted oxidoreductase